MPVADHPEYPSLSASVCAAHAEVSRAFLGDDKTGLEPFLFLKVHLMNNKFYYVNLQLLKYISISIYIYIYIIRETQGENSDKRHQETFHLDLKRGLISNSLVVALGYMEDFILLMLLRR